MDRERADRAVEAAVGERQVGGVRAHQAQPRRLRPRGAQHQAGTVEPHHLVAMLVAERRRVVAGAAADVEDVGTLFQVEQLRQDARGFRVRRAVSRHRWRRSCRSKGWKARLLMVLIGEPGRSMARVSGAFESESECVMEKWCKPATSISRTSAPWRKAWRRSAVTARSTRAVRRRRPRRWSVPAMQRQELRAQSQHVFGREPHVLVHLDAQDGAQVVDAGDQDARRRSARAAGRAWSNPPSASWRPGARRPNCPRHRSGPDRH